MADEIVFYTNPMSRGRTVRWMLEEVGAPYRTEILDYPGAMKAPAYLAINPMGKVPALTHGGQVITESVAICAYLADAFPQAGLAPPPGDLMRGPYFRWLFFAAGSLEYAVFNKVAGFEATPEQSRMLGYGTLDLTLDTLEAAVSRADYLVGDRFSTADLYICASLEFGMMMGPVPARSAFTRYVARMQERPAMQRATELDGPMPGSTPSAPPPAAQGA